jgi:hypothetical protein
MKRKTMESSESLEGTWPHDDASFIQDSASNLDNMNIYILLSHPLKRIGELMRVDELVVGVKNKSKNSEKDHKDDHNCIKQCGA